MKHGLRDAQHRGWTRVIRRAVSVIVIFLVTVGLMGVLALGIAERTGHLSLAPVLSGSMAPTAPTGSLALLWQVPTSDLKVGDVVSFYAPTDTTTPKMHRIVALAREGDATAITTKGDANNVADPWGKVTLRGATAYRMVGVVPYVGWAASIHRSWIYLLMIPTGALLGLAGLRDFRREPVNNQPHTAARGVAR